MPPFQPRVNGPITRFIGDWVSLVNPLTNAAISEKIARPAKNRNAVVNIREESMAAYLVT